MDIDWTRFDEFMKRSIARRAAYAHASIREMAGQARRRIEEILRPQGGGK